MISALGTILVGLRANRKLRFSRVRQFRFVLTTACKVKSRLLHIIMMLPRRGNIMLVSLFQTAITYRAIAQ
jgi:hypothetical protein